MAETEVKADPAAVARENAERRKKRAEAIRNGTDPARSNGSGKAPAPVELQTARGQATGRGVVTLRGGEYKVLPFTWGDEQDAATDLLYSLPAVLVHASMCPAPQDGSAIDVDATTESMARAVEMNDDGTVAKDDEGKAKPRYPGIDREVVWNLFRSLMHTMDREQRLAAAKFIHMAIRGKHPELSEEDVLNQMDLFICVDAIRVIIDAQGPGFGEQGGNIKGRFDQP